MCAETDGTGQSDIKEQKCIRQAGVRERNSMGEISSRGKGDAGATPNTQSYTLMVEELRNYVHKEPGTGGYPRLLTGLQIAVGGHATQQL